MDEYNSKSTFNKLLQENQLWRSVSNALNSRVERRTYTIVLYTPEQLGQSRTNAWGNFANAYKMANSAFRAHNNYKHPDAFIHTLPSRSRPQTSTIRGLPH